MKLYAFSGLGADARCFDFLNLDWELEVLEWIAPKKNEPIKEYASRISTQIDQSQPFGIVGLSFGGLIAKEVSQLLDPKVTVLISSVVNSSEIPAFYRLAGKLEITRILPKSLCVPPAFIANYMFSAQNKVLLRAILKDTDPTFAKWAIGQLTTWKNNDALTNPTIKITGSKDRLLPQKNNNWIKVQDAGHFMIVDRAGELSEILNTELRKFC